jgi:hypothetical protein
MLFKFFALLASWRGFARAGKGLSSAQFGAAHGERTAPCVWLHVGLWNSWLLMLGYVKRAVLLGLLAFKASATKPAAFLAFAVPCLSPPSSPFNARTFGVGLCITSQSSGPPPAAAYLQRYAPGLEAFNAL